MLREALDTLRIELSVNGVQREGNVEVRMTLADFLREHLRLTGTHIGCEQGACGACTLMIDGAAVRSCLMLAVQADGCAVLTIEGLAAEDGTLSPLQNAFWDSHSFQCGFCTPGFVMTAHALLKENPQPTEQEVRDGLSGNLCRCTGYQSIVDGVRLASIRLSNPTPASQS